ncbi:MAG: sulfotransferase [Pseudomonadota bacterium]
MTKAIVHIGYHKTSTTWFQKRFYPAVENVRYIPRNRVREVFLEDTAFHFEAKRAHAKLETDKDETIAICEEGLSGYLHTGGLAGYLSKEMAYRIKAIFPDAHIVIFVRNQYSMIAASYRQYIKGGGTYSIRRYLFAEDYLQGARAEIAKCPRFTFDHFEYVPLVSHYQSLFGAENVHVFPYEMLKETPEGFLSNFARRLDLEINLEKLVQSASNRSYGVGTMWIVRLLNHLTNRSVFDKHYVIHIPYWYELVRGVGEVLNKLPGLNWFPGSEAFLGRRLSGWITQRYCRSNAMLEKMTGLSLAQFGYPLEPTPSIETA